ncbi:MAG TPA: PKD domain-containing protein, partial [Flavitalea sp.]|nr:PKD domain-containing protein [Flavitalea sp.]
GDGTGDQKTTDGLGRISHQYTDTGTYRVTVKVILAGQCIDSTSTRARVYPGFFPGFIATGSCLYTPFKFSDTTRSRYGRASKWEWDFGDALPNDTSTLQSPRWLYTSLGLKHVQLMVESDKGCRDTISSEVEVRDLPLMSLAFKDTLICSIDSLQLSLTGNGIISWSPTTNLIGPTLPNPVVYPKTTTVYKVTLNENGCVNTDSVRVRVVDFVTLNAGADSTICLTDSARLSPITDGLQFSWSPAASLSDPGIKQPFAFPASQTTYTVTASIGKCKATDDVTIRTVPYPFANAGADTTICYQDSAVLNGKIVGTRFTWSPQNGLGNPGSLTTAAYPAKSTTYRLSAYDTVGCPKPGFDDVLVNVREKIQAFAGNDTAIVVGQPLQLSGQGAELFEWTPSLGLSNKNISNPVAQLDRDIIYTLRAYTEEGCFAMDTIKVTVFKTSPDIFVPNAFAPEGKNRILKPVTPGIAQLIYFRVFNRWGQLMFSTQEPGQGWDGKIAGKLQDTGTYVWMVSGKDYTGKIVTKKGTATLIR